MAAWSVVGVQPGCKSGGALGVGGEDVPVGPLGLQGAVEAFDLAVLPRAVRLDELLGGAVLGAYGPRVLEMTGRLADGWVPTQSYAAPEELRRMDRAIDETAQRAGRTPASVRRLYDIAGAFGTEAGFLQGSPAQWARQLADLALRDAMSGFLLASDSPSDVQRFGEEVAPAARARHRSPRQCHGVSAFP